MTNSKASFVSSSAALGQLDLDSIEWAMQAPLWKLDEDEVLLETVVDGGYCLWSTLWGADATPSFPSRKGLTHYLAERYLTKCLYE